MKHEISKGEWPWFHATEKWYDNQGHRIKRRDWQDRDHSWKAITDYVMVGGQDLKCSTRYSADRGNYYIKFDYYPNGNLKAASLKTDQGILNLFYDENGRLTTLEKTTNRKKTIFNYSYVDGKNINDSVLTANSLLGTYTSFYIDSTGGFERFDGVTDEANFAKMKKEGVIVTTDKPERSQKKERKLTNEEKSKAFDLLGKRKLSESSTKVYDRLEKIKSKDHEIGSDIKALDGGLIAVARMYEHTSWERGDGGWTPMGNGQQWIYEVDGAVVDIQKGEVIGHVNFDKVVRDSYDGGKDTHFLIDSNMMIRTRGKKVEFFMGNKYNTVASEKIDIDMALKIDAAKKRVKHDNEADEKKSSTATNDSKTIGKKSDGYSL